VDIDSQAVEVTKLSLLLKVLEGENKESLQELLFGRVRALPDLGQNIKCGNSLISPDYFAGQLMPDEEEMRRVNAFDWKAEFPEIMKTGGFDIVIGNPPYVFARELLTAEDKEYFGIHYKTIWEKPNTYMIFMERGLSLLNSQGVLSFIVPNSWLTVEAGKKLREVFSSRLIFLLDLLYPVFTGVNVETVILGAKKIVTAGKVRCYRVPSLEEFASPKHINMSADVWESNDGKIYVSSGSGIESVLKKMLAKSKRIGELFDVKTGLQAYEAGKGTPRQTQNDVENHVFDYDNKFDEVTFQYLDGKDVGRYELSWRKKWLRYGPWLSQPRTMDIFTRPRILIREITSSLPHCVNGVFCHEIFLNNKSILNVLHARNDQQALFFLLGQLNSKFLSVFYKHRAVKSARNLFPKIVIKDLRTFPCLPFNVNEQKCRGVATEVKRAHEFRKQLGSTRTPDERTRLQRKIDATDREIDRLVYDLYSLTEEEIKIVEAASVASTSKVKEIDGHDQETELAHLSRATPVSPTIE
ncbi:MAG: Eco57I restriction-modification methylase domain-containing protein, partial [Nitrospirae bacterium]|nr:Eco57I restriction-modification methylase domain-containing protein [Nitrospirota bacterium]